MSIKYKRVILKISGEALANNDNKSILDNEKLHNLALSIKKLVKNKVEVGIVIGAGNIFRGRLAHTLGLDQTNADYMGMLGTVINCIAFSSVLESEGIKNRVMSAVECNSVAEPYRFKKAIRHLEKGYVVLFAGGTGNPYCTTDTCSSLRALEVKADAILMGKNGIDGVYDKDPNKNQDAKFLDKITFNEIFEMNLNVIDQTAAAMLSGSKIEIKIFSMEDTDNFIKVCNGENIGTTITEE